MKRTAAGLLAGIVIAFAHGSDAVAGIYYEATTQATFGQAPAAGSAEMSVRGWIEGKNSKQVVSSGAEGMTSKEKWFLTRDGGETITVMSPLDKTYRTVNMKSLTGGLGDMFKAMGKQARISFKQPTSKKISEAAGPEILGYSTIHTVYESSYQVAIEVTGSTQKIVIRTRREYWTTDAVNASYEDTLLAGASSGIGVPGLDQILGKEKDTTPEGFPLKSVVVATNTVQGHSSTTKSATEVTKLEEREIGDDVFAIPSDYKQLEMPEPEQLAPLLQQ